MGGLSLALLELLRCPVNHATLRLLDEDALDRCLARVAAHLELGVRAVREKAFDDILRLLLPALMNTYNCLV